METHTTKPGTAIWEQRYASLREIYKQVNRGHLQYDEDVSIIFEADLRCTYLRIADRELRSIIKFLERQEHYELCQFVLNVLNNRGKSSSARMKKAL